MRTAKILCNIGVHYEMKIEIEFIGFPVIYDIFPEGRHPHLFSGETITQLVEDLIKTNEQRVREALLDERTKEFDHTIQVMINRDFIDRDQFRDKKIRERDHVTFLRLLAGG